MTSLGRHRSPLLASTSIVALMLGGAPAFATCAGFTGPFPTVNAGSVSGICIANTSFSGAVFNAGTGTITTNGIVVTNSTIGGGIVNGQIIDFGALTGGISIDAHSAITSTSTAVAVQNPTFHGSISNAGTITAVKAGINVFGVTTTLQGGVTNSGTITALGNLAGIAINGIALFGSTSAGGGIVNAGTIGTGNAAGIAVSGVTTFLGGITNAGSGSISGARGDILVSHGATFFGGIDNAGTLTGALGAGIRVSSIAVFGSTSAGGGITNSGTISPAGGAGGINVIAVTTFLGGVANTGTIASGGTGIALTSISTFAGGVANAGRIAAGAKGIDLLNVSNVSGGITNSAAGTITAGNDIVVAGVTTFLGGIANAGTLTATTAAVVVTHVGVFGSSIAGGGITNSGTISTAISGIFVGGTSAASATGTFFGGITNAGLITASNGITLDNVSTFLGGITNAGTIAANFGIFVSNVAMFGSAGAGGITNTGTITGANGIVIGAGVTFASGAAIVNTGTITRTVGAAINASAATSAVTIDQNGGLISGNIQLSANGDILNVNGGTIAGSITGQGASGTVNVALGAGRYGGNPGFAISNISALNVLSGSVVLDAATNSATNVTVTGGNLAVGDAANTGAMLTSASPVSVSGTGTLSGYGTVSGGVTVGGGGILAPGGATIGTVHVTGSVTFNPGSIYAVTVAPMTASSMVVGGTATLTGATVQATYQPGSYLTRQYVIVQSAGLVGTFAGLTNINLPTGVTASLSQTPTNAVLNLTAQLGSGLGNGGGGQNQQGVASSINNFFNGGGALPPGFVNLLNLTGGNLSNALSQLSGEAATGAQQGAFQMMTEFLGLMLDPFVDGRGDAGGGGAMGFAAERDELPPELASAYAAVFKAPVASAPPFAQRWAVWGGAYGGVDHAAGDTLVGSHDLTASAAGFAVGADYGLSPFTTLGFALAGGGTNWSLAQGLGGGRSDAFQAGAYGITHWGPAYLAGSLAFAEHWMSTSRTSFGLDALTAKFDAQSYGGRLEGGYRLATPTVAVTPYAALQSQAFVAPGYSETDVSGGGFGLTFAGRTATDTRGEVGSRFDHAVALDSTTLLMLRAKLGYAHDWVSNPSLAAAFQALPGASFIVNGAAPPHDAGLVSTGAELRFANGWSLAAKFDGEFAAHAQTYAGSATARYGW